MVPHRGSKKRARSIEYLESITAPFWGQQELLKSLATSPLITMMALMSLSSKLQIMAPLRQDPALTIQMIVYSTRRVQETMHRVNQALLRSQYQTERTNLIQLRLSIVKCSQGILEHIIKRRVSLRRHSTLIYLRSSSRPSREIKVLFDYYVCLL